MNSVHRTAFYNKHDRSLVLSLHLPELERRAWLNLGLAVVALTLLVYYVVQVNFLAAATWKLKDLRQELSVVRHERDDLVAQQSARENRTVLQTLATTYGLVPAGAVTYIVQPDAVATAR